MDFEKSNPEIIGEVFQLLIQRLDNHDPYLDLRHDYNELFLQHIDEFDQRIESFEDAIKYAIVGNIIDFHPILQNMNDDIMTYFQDIEHLSLAINHVQVLQKDLKKAKMLLYLGDNCGEICLDRLLLKHIRALAPHLKIYFGVRGQPVVNDSVEEDAYAVGIDQYAIIISNGDSSLGNVLDRTSQAFQDIYQQADIVIAKGQANFECLSEEKKNIYFLLMVKCAVISQYIGMEEKSLVCLRRRNEE